MATFPTSPRSGASTKTLELTATHQDWPDLPSKWERLRVRGSGLCALQAPRRIAIVGTRSADHGALRFAHRLAKEAAERGGVVVSGGALGIDAAAHRGALDGDGATVAVMAGGLNNLYPREHLSLFCAIQQTGLLVSAHDDDAPPRRAMFLQRNSLIAALAQVVVVVQAPIPSGALSTAAAARRFGKELWAVPAAPWDLRGAGNRKLLRGGARALVDLEELWTELDWKKRSSMAPPPKLPTCTAIEQGPGAERLWQCLSNEPRGIDELVRLAKVGAPEVQRQLLRWTLAGKVAVDAGGRYVRGQEG